MSKNLEPREIVIQELEESVAVKKMMAESLPGSIVQAAGIVVKAFKSGGKVLLAGNGGSAADAQHIAAELVGRFQMDRAALPAIALTTDTSILTAVANDHGFDTIFSRQVEALAGDKDVFIAITTGGTSPNVLKAAEIAHSKGVLVIALTGKNTARLRNIADLIISVPSDRTPRIQEAHITIGHIICHLVEKELFG